MTQDGNKAGTERSEFEKWYATANISKNQRYIAEKVWQARGQQIAARLRERAQEIGINSDVKSLPITDAVIDELRSLADEIGGK